MAIEKGPSKLGEEEHKKYQKKLFYIMAMIILLLTGGAFFYHNVEKWRYIDAFYFSAATMTTVGYGDISPKTDFGKLFTIFYVFTGVSVALYGLSILASHFMEAREAFWIDKLEQTGIRKHTMRVYKKIKEFVSEPPLIKSHDKLKNKK